MNQIIIKKDKTVHLSIKECWRWWHRLRMKFKRASGSMEFFLSHELSNKRQERYVESQYLRISSDTGWVAKRLWVANSRAMRYCWCQGTGALIMMLQCFSGWLRAANFMHFVLISVNSCMAHTEWSTGCTNFGIRLIINWNSLARNDTLSIYS